MTGDLQGKSEPPERNALRRAIEKGSDLTASAGGAAVGAVVGGPVGAVGGAAIGWATQELVKAGGEIAMRLLAPRAEARVGAVFRLVDDEISARLVAGEVPREDLRREITPGRSPAAELAEATLIAAAQTHEERKIPYLAHLLAAIVFELDLNHADANQLVTIADDLTYRQLVLLSVFAATEDTVEARGMLLGEGQPWAGEQDTLLSIRVDLLDLFRRGLIYVHQRRRISTVPELGFQEELPWPAVPLEMSFRDAFVSPGGERLARMMRLDRVPDEDREEVIMTHVRRPNRQ